VKIRLSNFLSGEGVIIDGDAIAHGLAAGGCGRGVPSCWGFGVVPPRKFLLSQMAVDELLSILTAKNVITVGP
jgi:hypothetical protein